LPSSACWQGYGDKIFQICRLFLDPVFLYLLTPHSRSSYIYIYDMMLAINQQKVADDYDLQPFKVKCCIPAGPYAKKNN